MQKRRLGMSSLLVSPICFGGNVLGWTADEATSFKLLDAFCESGANFIDTADVYSRWVPGHKGGESETILGRWLKRRGRRDQVIIATKVGMGMPEVGSGLSRAHIERSIDASLKRLNTDYVDLYQSHTDDDKTPLEETLSTYARLVKAGKVRHIGASNFNAARLAASLSCSRANGWPAYVSLQPEYSLAERSRYEGELMDLCVRENVGVIGYYSLASGFLTGKYRPGRDKGASPRAERAASYLNERGLRILAALDHVAATHRTNPTRIALAWLMARPAVAAPIASATSLLQLHDLTGATAIRLSVEEMARLTGASAPD
jgi:aryl-alcohol dehydrogenase-like predicted oxidoreductase